MKEPYTEGLATHGDPESCAGGARDQPKAAGEALTGACTGRDIEPRNLFIQSANVLPSGGGNTAASETRARSWLCAVKDPSQVQNLFAREPGDPLTARAKSPGRNGRAQALSRR